MKNDRLGLLMIAASLVVIAIISSLLYKDQINLLEEKTCLHGVAPTRAMSSMNYSQLTTSSDKGGLMRILVDIQDNENLALQLGRLL